MKITNEFAVNTPIERAWAVLTDLAGIAPCMPGAQLTGVEGDTYSGKVKVKVGPVVSDFAGTARFVEKDDGARRAVIDAKGRDSRSAGNAAALVTAQLRADGDRTLVSVETDLKISGKLAQFGNGMIKEVSGKLLGQFVTNLEAKLATEDPSTATADAPAPATSAGAGQSSAAASAAPSALRRAAPDVAPLSAEPGSAEAATAPGDWVAADPHAEPGGADVVTGPGDRVAADPHAEPGGADVVTGSGDRVAAGSPTQSAGVDEEPAALDLLALAGSSVYKRVVPIGIGIAAVAAVIIWFVARR